MLCLVETFLLVSSVKLVTGADRVGIVGGLDASRVSGVSSAVDGSAVWTGPNTCYVGSVLIDRCDRLACAAVERTDRMLAERTGGHVVALGALIEETNVDFFSSRLLKVGVGLGSGLRHQLSTGNHSWWDPL
jgi:hypothetical protein